MCIFGSLFSDHYFFVSLVRFGCDETVNNGRFDGFGSSNFIWWGVAASCHCVGVGQASWCKYSISYDYFFWKVDYFFSEKLIIFFVEKLIIFFEKLIIFFEKLIIFFEKLIIFWKVDYFFVKTISGISDRWTECIFGFRTAFACG